MSAITRAGSYRSLVPIDDIASGRTFWLHDGMVLSWLKARLR